LTMPNCCLRNSSDSIQAKGLAFLCSELKAPYYACCQHRDSHLSVIIGNAPFVVLTAYPLDPV
jgi:hypothetical protein